MKMSDEGFRFNWLHDLHDKKNAAKRSAASWPARLCFLHLLSPLLHEAIFVLLRRWWRSSFFRRFTTVLPPRLLLCRLVVPAIVLSDWTLFLLLGGVFSAAHATTNIAAAGSGSVPENLAIRG